MTEAKATAAHVYQAITAVTAEIARDGIGKDRSNTQQNYKFRGIDDVYNALASCLAKNHLCILPRVLSRECSERPTTKGGVMSYVVLDVEFSLVSSLDGSSHVIRTVGEAMDSADKATNKAMSAAMKYACLMAFQIPTEGDNDADAHHPERSSGRNGASGGQQTPPARGNDTGASRAGGSQSRKFESDPAVVEALCIRIASARAKRDLDSVVNDTRAAYAQKKLSDADWSHIARSVKARGEAINGRQSERDMSRQPGED